MGLAKSLKKRATGVLRWWFICQHRWLHRWGVLPMSRDFGSERGTPVGRYYVEKFLREQSEHVRGRCLDFGDARYKSFFPGADEYLVLNVAPGPEVDFVCDLHDVSPLGGETFDTVICPQVFEHLSHPEKAAVSLYQLIRPGGTLLLTAPFINQVHYVPTDFRRFTPECLRMMLEEAGLVVDRITFGGNSAVSTGSLLGMVVEDFTVEELDARDPIYPYNVLIRAHRPS